MVPLRASGGRSAPHPRPHRLRAFPYEEADLALLQALAARAALAVDNARLYGEAQEAVRAREETMGVVSHDLATRSTPPS